MTAWWSERSERERTGIIAMAALVVMLGLFQFGLKPLLAMRAGAQTDYDGAMTMLARVEADAQRAQSLRADMPARAPVPLRTAVSAAANAQGLTLTRVQPLENGELDVWLDDVASKALFTWLSGLTETHGITVSRVTVQRGGAGVVSARITLAGGAL